MPDYSPDPAIAAAQRKVDALVTAEDLAADVAALSNGGPPALDALRGLPTDPTPPVEAVVPILRDLAVELGPLDPLGRAVAREVAVRLLGERGIRSPARLVDAAMPATDGDDATSDAAATLRDPEPWPEWVAGAGLLDDLARTVTTYVVMPPGGATAASLWVIGTYLYAAVSIFPRLLLSSPAPRSGKSILLDVLGELVARPLAAESMTEAVLFRVIDKANPTLLLDEADRWVADERKRPELVGLLNSGHRRGGVVWRCVGDDNEPTPFEVYGPVVLAAIGRMPPTLQDRSIVVPMRRRRQDEAVSRLRMDHTEWAVDLRRRCARWAVDHADVVGGADPDLPAGLHDRAADNWRVLVAIADVAGGRWPAAARKAAALLSGGDQDADGIGETLLGDLRVIFGAEDRMKTETILERLHALEERPWPEWGRARKPISSVQLARLLRPFGVRPRNVRIGGEVPKGYLRSDLEEAWSRYAPPSEPLHRHNVGAARVSGDSDPLHSDPSVAGREQRKPLGDKDCSGVAAQKGGAGGEGGSRLTTDDQGDLPL
ncbi:MAG TPA: DUF3631 domain-containing protein [Thermoanaerobaculia bacterium]|nr:DUF3631 domain-containing protein [Thermoanaerobaculia bacterium]